MPQAGDTVRLRVEFKDFDESLFDPGDVKLLIYDKKQDVIDGPFIYDSENPELGDVERVSVGVYFCEYTIPMLLGAFPLYFEYSGQIRGKTALRRGILDAKFYEE